MQRTYFRNRKPKANTGEKKPKRKLEDMDFWDLVKILDVEFSYNLRAGKAARQGHPWITCYTCGKRDLWNSGKMHCGHFIGREYFGTRWDARNTRVQCVTCNSFHEGEKAKYAERLEQEGVDLKSLRLLAEIHGRVHPPKESLLAWIKEYRAYNKHLAREIKGMEGS